MCGRFVNIEKKERIQKLFPSLSTINYSDKCYNISPSSLINVIYKKKNMTNDLNYKNFYPMLNKLEYLDLMFEKK